MPKRSVILNVSICPSDAVFEKSIAASKTFKARGAMFALDRKRHCPHITVYMAKFPRTNIGAVVRALRGVAGRASSLPMKAIAYRRNANGYIGVDFNKTKAVAALQRGIVGALNEFREGLQYATGGLRFTAGKRKNFARYGYDAVGYEFRPHLSLTRLRDGSKKARFDSLPAVGGFSFSAKYISLGLVGKHFAFEKLIKKFKLRD